MIQFVNAKINIGLSVTNRRPDGYHDLETLFYPVGLHNGTPENPVPFCDVLQVRELAGTENDQFRFSGRKIDCEPEKNLVVKATRLFREECGRKSVDMPAVEVSLRKHIPDGAGLGGGSADAGFVLRSLNELLKAGFSAGELQKMALRLGADCPFFIENRPLYASGVGEIFSPVDLDLAGRWAVIVKPDVYISTREAFAGITPRPARFDLRHLGDLPIEEWRNVAVNDFEASVFPSHPELAVIKRDLYARGALYASMSGSGSAIYGIFSQKEDAENAAKVFEGHSVFVCLL